MTERRSRYLKAVSIAPIVGVIFLALSLSLVAGIVSASGNINAVATFSGMIVAGGMLMSRNALLWLIVFGGLVVVGVTQLYFPGVRYIRYVFPLAGFGLILHGLLDQLSKPAVPRPNDTPRIMPWAAAFAAVAGLSLLVNFSTLGVAITGIKTYFQMWPFLLGLVLIRWTPDPVPVIAKAMLLISLIQLPFVLHQYLYLVPIRSNLPSAPVAFQPVDVIAGTFGASMFGGGANAVLAAFMIGMIACLAGLWKHGAIKARTAAILSLLFLFPLLLNQTKISILYLLLVYLVLFYKEVVQRPVRFLLASAVALGLFALLMTAMTLNHPREGIDSWQDLVNYTIERQQSSVQERQGQFSELTRWTALTFWADEHARANPLYTLIGHGPGASRVQDRGLDLAETLAEEKYGGLQIGYTAVSALLWDTGILGLITILGLFIAAFRTASSLSKYYNDTDFWRAGLFKGLQATVVVILLSLAHKDFFIFHIPYQTLVMLLLGVLVIGTARVTRGDSNTLGR